MTAHFWSTPVDRLASELRSGASGLSTIQVSQAVPTHSLTRRSSFRSDTALLLTQFKSPIVLLLLIASILSAALGDHLDSAIILTIVIISGGLSFFQECGARYAVKSMLRVIETHCRVVRDGIECDIKSSQVVSGDLVLLSAGATMPADCIILESKELFVDEAALTGETFPVEKHAGVVPDSSPINQRWNCVFAGTHVVSGSAKVLAVHTQAETEFGKIFQGLAESSPETDFERGVRMFGYFLMEITLLLVLAIFAINVFLHRPVLQSFMFSLALAVGLTPQLLPAIMSINLAMGAKKMAAKKVIVKRLSSIESFGSMNVLCSDKTGTLTEGCVEIKAALDVDGNESEKVRLLAFLNASMETGFTNPIDVAIRQQQGLSLTGYEKLDEIPYDFSRKRLTVLVAQNGPGNSSNCMISKGALKKILDVCSHAEIDSKRVPLEEVRVRIDAEMISLSSRGLRVLGIATKEIESDRITVDSETDMTLVGLLVFADPPKVGIAATIRKLNDLGVTLKIITGDNRLVAAALAKQIGFEDPKVLSAQEILGMSSDALARVANEIDVFSEVEPNQKEQIIAALRKSGNVVGYVGDGINDAPALHAADVGISVNNAVDVAKEAAQLVMLEHDLDVLVEGIREGRKTFANTMKYIFMATSANFGNMFSMAGVSLFLPFLPLLPHQILLTNLLTDLPELTIATDDVDEELVAKPMCWNINFIRLFMLTFGSLSSVFDFITFFILYFVIHTNQQEFRTGWFLESVISAAFVVLVIRTSRTIFKSKPSSALSLATVTVVIAACTIPFVPFSAQLGFTPIAPRAVFAMFAVVVVYIASAEVLKRVFYKHMTVFPIQHKTTRKNKRFALRNWE